MPTACVSFDSIVDPRAAATVRLLAIVGVAAFGLTLSPPSLPRTSVDHATAPAPVERTAATPVRIVGATPRSEACDAQVWPYIEGRCLVRAAEAPARPAETGTAPAQSAETTGAAPALASQSVRPPTVAPSAAPEQRPRVRAASIELRLPPRRALGSASALNDAWADDIAEQPTYAAPRRRAGRAHRGERGWGRHRMLPLFFR